MIGAQVKNRAANEQHVASSGTQLFGLNQAVKQVPTRLYYGYQLNRAVTLADDHNLRAAVNLGTQIQAGVPRFLWPGKPPVDYGQQVSVAAYSLRYGQSSSFLTDVGDQYVNFKVPGVVIGALLLGPCHVRGRTSGPIRPGTAVDGLRRRARLLRTDGTGDDHPHDCGRCPRVCLHADPVGGRGLVQTCAS
ncbi:MAG: hypothetical protein DLM58_13695 [Pseudonocardiales bacterium]|nr:MAG: hypothetical protein DLM58_13695 [Pseudonocardiales bacterium]